MVRYENDCVGCGLPCLGSVCTYRNVPHLYCDECNHEVDKLYYFDTLDGKKHWCEECIIGTALADLEPVTADENYCSK